MNYEEEINKIWAELKKLNAASSIPFDIGEAFKIRTGVKDFPQELKNAPAATVADPAGGATSDGQARTAINSIIDRLQELGLIE